MFFTFLAFLIFILYITSLIIDLYFFAIEFFEICIIYYIKILLYNSHFLFYFYTNKYKNLYILSKILFFIYYLCYNELLKLIK